MSAATSCEYAFVRRLDVKLGWAEPLETKADPMLERAAQLGDAHEHRVLEVYRRRFGVHTPGTPGGVADIPVLGVAPEELAAAQAQTVAALRDGADVVFQGAFFDGRLHGRSDFLVRLDDRYAVYDTKLARRAKVDALLQLAAYASQLERLEVPLHPEVGLILGDADQRDPQPVLYPLDDLLAVYRDRRVRLEALADAHVSAGTPTHWHDDRYTACGRCDVCAEEVAAHRDVLLVAGIRLTQRARLADAGIATIDELAAMPTDAAVEGIAASTLARLRDQARLQVAQDARPLRANGTPEVEAVVIDPGPIRALPAPDPGDIFFDFEGDPLWSEPGSSDAGLEYLFGWVEADTGEFRTLWAHDRAQERAALGDFLDYLVARHAAHPAMHVYHYAAYEVTALKRLVGRHGLGEDALDDMLRAEVFVDLFRTVRTSLQVSQPSYSLKYLEPLYVGDEVRTGVATAVGSVAQYALACAAADAGETDERERLLAEIGEYNGDDCRSTLRLCGWLRGLVPADVVGAQVMDDDTGTGATPTATGGAAAEEAALAAPLLAHVPDVPMAERTPDQQAYAMLAAAIGYHRREDKPQWWAHFDRLVAPPDEWADTRDTFLVSDAEVVSEWAKPTLKSNPRRGLRLRGEWAPGSTPKPGKVNVLYAEAVPEGVKSIERGLRGWREGDLVGIDLDDDGEEGIGDLGADIIEVEERLGTTQPPYEDVPVAVTPGDPVPTGALRRALHELGERVVAKGLVDDPGLDVLRRRPPRTRSGALPEVGDGPAAPIDAIVAALRDLDRSYVAVQGPPGTGKTYVGAHVVAQLVRDGWHVGVVAQSHAVVQNLLDRIIDAGVPGEAVAKHPKHAVDPGWTTLAQPDHLARFLAERGAAGVGAVVGGTAWDFTNRKRVRERQLDLLVIDEAGQFSLANTLAVAAATDRLLLLGDPQQLPQVSQGTHPEPVDTSALGWLAEGHATLPADRGYFLAKSWRMHPDLCVHVSRLAYDGRLASRMPETAARSLTSLTPGLHVVSVPHDGCATACPEEAAEVVAQVQRVMAGTWCDPEHDTAPRSVEQGDVLVVAPYNAQVHTVRQALAAAALGDVRVGTVDKFQGQEAPVVIVSMTASSAQDVPRGVDFLLDRHRLNVAVSRGQWAAIVLHAPQLTDFLPHSPAGLAQLGGLLRLVEPTAVNELPPLLELRDGP